MLSFLRDQKPAENTSNQSAAANRKVAKTGQAAPDVGFISVANKDKSVRKTSLLLAVSFGIGLICLIFMIRKSTPETAKASNATNEQQQIEMAITRVTGIRSEMLDSMDDIVNKFYEFSNVEQINVDDLAKNPFELQANFGDAKQIGNQDNSNLNAEIMKRQQLRYQADNLQLLSIMQSDRGNCCMIDDKILYNGDTIRGFKVTRISNTDVKLESAGMQIILKLEE